IFYMVAQPNATMAEDAGYNPVDNRERSMYWAMYEKDVDNARIMRALKRIAIDAQANLDRNIRPGIEDGTPEADYTTAAYTPFKLACQLEIVNCLDKSSYSATDLYIARDKIHD